MSVSTDLIPIEIDALILLADARRDGRRHVSTEELLDDLDQRGYAAATAAPAITALETLRARRLVEGRWVTQRWSVTDFGASVAEDLRERRS